MRPAWVGLLVFVWIIAGILGSVASGSNLLLAEGRGVEAGENDPIQVVMSYTERWTEQTWGTLVDVGAHAEFFRAIFKLMLLNFPLFGDADSPFQIVMWVIVGPVMAVLVFGMVMLFIGIFRRVV